LLHPKHQRRPLPVLSSAQIDIFFSHRIISGSRICSRMPGIQWHCQVIDGALGPVCFKSLLVRRITSSTDNGSYRLDAKVCLHWRRYGGWQQVLVGLQGRFRLLLAYWGEMCLKTEEEWAVDITNVSLVATAIAARPVSLLLYMYPNRLKLNSMGSGVRSEQKAGGTR